MSQVAERLGLEPAAAKQLLAEALYALELELARLGANVLED